MASETVPDPLLEVNDVRQFSPPSQKKSWQELKQTIKVARKAQSTIASKVPLNFTFRLVPTEFGAYLRLYFLGIPDGSRENTLLFSDLANSNSICASTVSHEWKPVLDSFLSHQGKILSKEEQLLRERKRVSHFGITSYDVNLESGDFVFPAAGNLYTFCDLHTDALTGTAFPKEIKTSAVGPKMDPKICPSCPELVAYICNNDLWVANHETGCEERLTFAHKGTGTLKTDPKSAGVPSFVVQEEFDRYTGFWWVPSESNKKFTILYEEVDEGDVDLVYIVSSTGDESGYDEYRYPKAGTPNAKSELKLVEFELSDQGTIEKVVIKHLIEPLSCSYPWMEYLVRAGCTPDGAWAWAQILDRPQQHLAVILIPTDCFTPSNDDFQFTSFRQNSSPPSVRVIYEDTSDIWVNIHDIIHFFPQSSPNTISFLWASEKTGYRHLYRITSQLSSTDSSNEDTAMDIIEDHLDIPKPNVIDELQITSGDWEVLGKQVWVDEEKELVYFTGLKDTPLEAHLYVTSYSQTGEPQRLTELGYSHAVTLDCDCTMFVSVYSSISTSPCCQVYSIVHDEESRTTFSKPTVCIMQSQTPQNYQAPELFKFVSKNGHIVHGMLCKPHDFEEGKKYPVIQFVYGGPQVQLVTNAYKGTRFLRLHILATLGYAVVVIDGRGSINRGLMFESHLKHRMGRVEIEDQVEGLEWVANHHADYIDLSRAAIHGWSYGGYLSLMGLLQRPDVYKIAVAGAPVTSWHLYDTGYTERYMGMPDINSEAYRLGSVLENVAKFPTEENRLLIVHGLIDENVHFSHSSQLVAALIKGCKPYQLQVYPNERHGIRSPDGNEHYETMLLSFLQQHL